MSKADMMFEKLGYTKNEITDEFINYFKKELRYKSQKEWEICISFNCYDKYLMTKNKPYFAFEEIQAINEKCKELRMDGGIEYGRKRYKDNR